MHLMSGRDDSRESRAGGQKPQILNCLNVLSYLLTLALANQNEIYPAEHITSKVVFD